jgi:hypothetical protein
LIKYEDAELYADLAAEKPIAAERQGQKIVVEIKSFAGKSLMYDFHNALGQYIVYRNFNLLNQYIGFIWLLMMLCMRNFSNVNLFKQLLIKITFC